MTTLAERVPPEFWPTIDRIDQLSAEYGFPTNLRGMLEQIAIMDPDAIRAVLPAWGTGGADGLPGQMNEGVLSGRITFVTAKLNERWEGTAWDAFDRDMTHVQGLLKIIGEPARMAGDALSEFLDLLELSWQEIVSVVIEVVGLVLAIVGAVTAAVAGAGIVLAVVGLIISAIGMIINDNQRATARLNAYRDATQRFREQVTKLGPAVRGGPYPTPRSADWDRITPDPNT